MLHFYCFYQIIPIEASMENNRHKFSQTMNIVVVGFTVLIACLSSLGYLHYGSQTKQIIGKLLEEVKILKNSHIKSYWDG